MQLLRSAVILLAVCCCSWTQDDIDPGNPAKTRLCADKDCKEALFSTTVIRENRDRSTVMLPLAKIGEEVKVYSIRYSDRPDFWLGSTEAHKEHKLLYKTFVDRHPYVDFLRAAIKSGRVLYHVPVSSSSSGRPRQVVHVEAKRELAKEFEVVQTDLGISPVETVQLDPEPSTRGHGHSHGGHGHSHGGHGHSHGDDGHQHQHDEHEENDMDTAELEDSHPAPNEVGNPDTTVTEPLPEAAQTEQKQDSIQSSPQGDDKMQKADSDKPAVDSMEETESIDEPVKTAETSAGAIEADDPEKAQGAQDFEKQLPQQPDKVVQNVAVEEPKSVDVKETKQLETIEPVPQPDEEMVPQKAAAQSPPTPPTTSAPEKREIENENVVRERISKHVQTMIAKQNNVINEDVLIELEQLVNNVATDFERRVVQEHLHHAKDAFQKRLREKSTTAAPAAAASPAAPNEKPHLDTDTTDDVNKGDTEENASGREIVVEKAEPSLEPVPTQPPPVAVPTAATEPTPGPTAAPPPATVQSTSAAQHTQPNVATAATAPAPSVAQEQLQRHVPDDQAVQQRHQHDTVQDISPDEVIGGGQNVRGQVDIDTGNVDAKPVVEPAMASTVRSVNTTTAFVAQTSPNTRITQPPAPTWTAAPTVEQPQPTVAPAPAEVTETATPPAPTALPDFTEPPPPVPTVPVDPQPVGQVPVRPDAQHQHQHQHHRSEQQQPEVADGGWHADVLEAVVNEATVRPAGQVHADVPPAKTLEMPADGTEEYCVRDGCAKAEETQQVAADDGKLGHAHEHAHLHHDHTTQAPPSARGSVKDTTTSAHAVPAQETLHTESHMSPDVDLSLTGFHPPDPEHQEIGNMSTDEVAGWVLALRRVCKPLADLAQQARPMLPGGDALRDIDDVGALLLLIAPATFVIHLVCYLSRWLGKGTPPAASIIAARYATMSQQHQATQRELRELKASVQQTGTSDAQIIAEARQSQERSRLEVEALSKQLQDALSSKQAVDNQLHTAKSSLQEKTVIAATVQEREAKLRAEHNILVDEKRAADDQISSLQMELESANQILEEQRERLDTVDRELKDRTIELNHCKKELHHLEKKVKDLTVQCDELSDKLQVTSEERDGLRLIVDECRAADTDNTGSPAKEALDSNGSGGWSDFGDEEASENRTKAKPKPQEKSGQRKGSVPAASGEALLDVAKLRARVAALEGQLEGANRSASRTQSALHEVESRCTDLQQQLGQLRQQKDDADAERRDAFGQAKQLTHMLNQKEEELRNKQTEMHGLREALAKMEQEVRTLQEQLAIRDAKLSDASDDTKRLRRELEKQESRHFQESREFRAQQAQMADELRRARARLETSGLLVPGQDRLSSIGRLDFGGVPPAYGARDNTTHLLHDYYANDNSSEAELVQFGNEDSNGARSPLLGPDAGDEQPPAQHRRRPASHLQQSPLGGAKPSRTAAGGGAATAAAFAVSGIWSSLPTSDPEPEPHGQAEYRHDKANRPKSRTKPSVDGRRSAGQPTASAVSKHRRSVPADQFEQPPPEPTGGGIDAGRRGSGRQKRARSKPRPRDPDGRDYGAPMTAGDVYSSPGSEMSGQSPPPPEMALISGVPPSGLRGPLVRRPAHQQQQRQQYAHADSHVTTGFGDL